MILFTFLQSSKLTNSTQRFQQFETQMRILISGGSGFIGSVLIQTLVDHGHSVCSLDLVQPKQIVTKCETRLGDIRNNDFVKRAVEASHPEAIIHLAARTDLLGSSEDDYSTNIQGTKNICDAAKELSGLRHFVAASSMLVCRPGYQPTSDLDVCPINIYGQSKVATENIIRSSQLKIPWTIIRPTTIWGQGHYGLRDGFFKILRKGLYIHPHNIHPIRSYGYVGNVAYQLKQIIESEPSKTHKKTFYVGDEPLDLTEWVNLFSVALRQREVATCPIIALKGLACFGDILNYFGCRFPLTTYRLVNMTTDNIIDMEPTFQAIGKGPFDLDTAVSNTVKWLKE